MRSNKSKKARMKAWIRRVAIALAAKDVCHVLRFSGVLAYVAPTRHSRLHKHDKTRSGGRQKLRFHKRRKSCEHTRSDDTANSYHLNVSILQASVQSCTCLSGRCVGGPCAMMTFLMVVEVGLGGILFDALAIAVIGIGVRLFAAAEES